VAVDIVDSFGRNPRMRIAFVAVLATLACAGAAHAQPFLGFGGYFQPSYTWQQQDDQTKPQVIHQGGFSIFHARPYIVGGWKTGAVTFEVRTEAELFPQFQLLDAYVGMHADLPGRGFVRLVFGQHFAPFSRQTMLSATDFQIALPAELISLAPGRQIGFSAQLNLPYAPWAEITAGVFNGEGVDVLENVDSNYMFVGRLAFKPLGTYARPIESALGPTTVSVAGDVSWNVRNQGDYDERTLLVGADAFASWRGISAYAEYLFGNVTYTKPTQANYHKQGLNIQAGYLLPIPGRLYRRFEIAGRFEEIQPNDNIFIEGAGDPNQVRASWVAAINYYHRGHWLKAQLAYYHNVELQQLDRNGNNAVYDNDKVLLIVTGRLEYPMPKEFSWW
jgi:hypothetical protein